MAKHSMRGYYALGALVLGIILLYVIVRNVEPFQSQEEVHVYFKHSDSTKIENVTSNSKIVSATGKNGTLTLTIAPSYRINSINDIRISSVNTKNCTTRISGTQYCWANVKQNNEIELNKIRLNSYIKQPTNNTKLTNSLNFTGLFKNNLVEPTQVPPTLVADPRSKGMPPGANVRITLTLTKK